MKSQSPNNLSPVNTSNNATSPFDCNLPCDFKSNTSLSNIENIK